jgi:hypothetical protein
MLNIRATPATINPFIVKAAAKATNFAEISVFTIFSSMGVRAFVLSASHAPRSGWCRNGSSRAAEKSKSADGGRREPGAHCRRDARAPRAPTIARMLPAMEDQKSSIENR